MRGTSSSIWQISPRGVSRPGARHFFLGEKVPKTPPGTPRPPYRQTGTAFSPSISKMPLSPPAVRACSSFRAARSAARCPGGRRWCTAPCSAKCGRHCRLQVWGPSVSQAGRRSGGMLGPGRCTCFRRRGQKSALHDPAAKNGVFRGGAPELIFAYFCSATKVGPRRVGTLVGISCRKRYLSQWGVGTAWECGKAVSD